jgi:hypothetical protein
MSLNKILKISILALLISPRLTGQINDGTKFISIIQGQSYIDTINSNFFPYVFVENCSNVKEILPNKKVKITISPPQGNPNYLGKARSWAQYTDGTKPRYITWEINFVPSIITTKDDYTSVTVSDTISILPLINDFSSTGSLSLVGLGNVEGGQANMNGGEVRFIMDSNVSKGYVQYSVKDGVGSVANGLIHIIREETSFNANDTLRFTLKNTRKQAILLPSIGFTLLQNGTKGVVNNLHPLVFEYTPNNGVSGQDTLILGDALNNTRVVVLKLINIPQNTSSVRDDKFYTPKNTPITFDVFANDLSSNFPITNASSALVRDTLGVFTYTPPTGFSGVKNFTYTVNYGQYQDVGKIAIYIGNFAPVNSDDYTFNTLKNQSLVLNYDVPLEGYTFNVLNQPNFGMVEVLQNTNVGEGCDEFYSKLTLIYTPDNNYYGQDSFDLEYCVANNPCIVYKAYINIHDIALDTVCRCKGPDCVWSGDLNGDGRVSVVDLLSIGRFGGLNGNVRSDLSFPYRAGQYADDWKYTQPNGVNIKHIDANGDGIINPADTVAIADYYADIHAFVPEEVLAIKDYPFALIPNATELDSGDLLILDVAIGSNTSPLVDIFGLAFGLNVSPAMIDSASLSVNFDKSSWFSNNSPTLQMYKQPKEGKIHAAFTRTSSIVEDEVEGIKPPGVSGNGIIGQIVFIVEDEVEGIKSSDDFITRRISTNGIQMEDADGERYQLPDTYIDVKVRKNSNAPNPTSDKLIVFPNPATENVLLHFNGRNEIKGYKVYNQMGELIIVNNEVNAQATSINVQNLPLGMYVVKVVTTQGTITKKILVSPRK